MRQKSSFRFGRWIVLTLAACILAGCIPKTIVWSPDGGTAAIASDNGLYVCDTNGVLAGPFASNVTAMAWFPDSARLAIARSVKYSS